jgi:hypothetical protein
MKLILTIIACTAAIIATLLYLKRQPEPVELQINGMNAQELKAQQEAKTKIYEEYKRKSAEQDTEGEAKPF